MSMNEDISNEARLAAVNDAATRDKELASTHFNLFRTLRQLKDECKKEIRSAIGAGKLEDYEKAHERAKQRFLDLANVTRSTTESLKLASQMRRQVLTDVKQTVGRLGIDAKKIEAIQKKYISEARSEIERAFLAREEAPYVEVSPGEAPTRSHNPWQWRSAPYDGQWGTQGSDGTRGTRWVSHFENRLTGEINCWSSMNISGADDSDFTTTTAYSELQFWFQMPAAGLVEVWLYLQAIDTPWGGCLEDEWGISDADIQQRSQPYLWVISPFGNPRYGTLLDYRRGEDEGCWGGTIASGGDYRYAHLFSYDSYAAGQWILCGVGILDYNYFWVDDETCNTYLTNRWFLRDVAVRSTGAP